MSRPEAVVVLMTKYLHGNDLQIFVSAEVKRLAKEVWREDIYRAGSAKLVAELEDGSSVFVSTLVGESPVIQVLPFADDGTPKYRRIYDRTPEAVRQLLVKLLQAMEPYIIDAIRRNS